MKYYIVSFVIDGDTHKSNEIKAHNEDEAALKFDMYFSCCYGYTPEIYSVDEC